jgi:hypothetical protein
MNSTPSGPATPASPSLPRAAAKGSSGADAAPDEAPSANTRRGLPSDSGKGPGGSRDLVLVAARCAGALLLLISVLPLYRLLSAGETGLAGSYTVDFLDLQYDMMWTSVLLMLLLGLLGARLLPAAADVGLAARLRHLTRPGIVVYATGLAVVTAAAGAIFALLVLDGMPNHIDSIAQLTHARFWADGRLAGPLDDGGGFWMIQNSLFTDAGWVSQYPPGHVFILAAFSVVGLPWAAGPAMLAVTVFFSTLTIERVLRGRPLEARVAAALLAVSPFFIFLGASFMNHVTAAAAISVGCYALVRAWDTRPAWAVASGFAFSFAFATRPLSALAIAAALVLTVPAVAGARFISMDSMRRGLLLALGAAPVGILLMLYNSHFFGGAFTFGYHLTLGDGAGLGLGRDPWGNVYGAREALAYTSADLIALGSYLLEAPLTPVIIIAAFLLLCRPDAGERMVAAWALAPVAAGFFYWHHGLFMGPRMLHEAAPAWVFLTFIAMARLIRLAPRSLAFAGFRPRAGLVATFALAVSFGLLVAAPQRAHSYGGDWLGVTRAPAPSVDGPALVFVHDAWIGRIAMTLAANGFTLGTVESLVRQNSTCRVHELAAAVASGNSDAAAALLRRLDTEPRASGLPAAVRISPGNLIWMEPGEVLSEECAVQVRADARGILDLAPLLWRGDLPGGEGDGVLYVRDLGPDRNAVLLAALPERQPWVYMMPGLDARSPVLLPYDQGMDLLWRQD